jgi:hypothetical protein
MTPKQVKSLRDKLAKWDALVEEAAELKRFMSDFDGMYANDSFRLQFDSCSAGVNVPQAMQARIFKETNFWVKHRLAEIEREKQELKIDG